MKKWSWLMVLVIFAVTASGYAETLWNPVRGNDNLKYPSGVVQYYRGEDGLYYDVVETTLTDTILSVNPYTEVQSDETNVKGFRIHARTGIDVRVAFGSDNTSTNYTVLHAGDTLKEDNLYMPTISIKLLGDSTTDDTGIVSIIWKK